MSEQRLTKVTDGGGCFVCGMNNPHGLRANFNVDREAHTSHLRLTLGEQFQGWQGVVHGGILATLLDEACAYACMTVTDQCVTAEINVRYRQPLQVGQSFEVKGRLIEQKHKLLVADAQIIVDDVVYAQADGKLFNLALQV